MSRSTESRSTRHLRRSFHSLPNFITAKYCHNAAFELEAAARKGHAALIGLAGIRIEEIPFHFSLPPGLAPFTINWPTVRCLDASVTATIFAAKIATTIVKID